MTRGAAASCPPATVFRTLDFGVLGFPWRFEYIRGAFYRSPLVMDIALRMLVP